LLPLPRTAGDSFRTFGCRGANSNSYGFKKLFF